MILTISLERDTAIHKFYMSNDKIKMAPMLCTY